MLVGIALLAGACGSGGRDAATPTPSPFPPATVSPTPEPDLEATLYFLGDTALGLRLYPEVRTIPGDPDPALAAARALVDAGLAPLDPDLASPWTGAGARVNGITRTADEVVVDLHPGNLNVGAEAEQRAIEQLLWTLVAADPDIEAMRITADGEPLESLAGHVDTLVAFTLGPDDAVLAPVTIAEPEEGDEVASPVTVTGEACVFEANVAWELLLDGTRVDSGSTLASEACPVRSPWSVDLGDLEPGTYVFRALEYSAKDGSLVSEDSKTFTVTG